MLAHFLTILTAIWIALALIVGAIGSSRNIGFFGAFILSVLLSPVIGLVFALLSNDQVDEKIRANILQGQRQQGQYYATAELEKLARLREGGHITQEEFDNLKTKILPEPATLHVYNPELFIEKRTNPLTTIVIILVLVIIAVVVIAATW
jgi:mannose/fructose/N-acetylgalactosamine-specific phosphotransferase system component IID